MSQTIQTPRTKAALLRFLKENPQVINVTRNMPMTFHGTSGSDIVFTMPNGRKSFIPGVKASDLSFDDRGFTASPCPEVSVRYEYRTE